MINELREEKKEQTIAEIKGKPTSLRQQMFKKIKYDIITCELAPGESISESELAERFGVSKTPIREALTSLQQCNLVEYITNRGFRVSQISYEDVQEIYEARMFYEAGLFRMALKNITDSDVRFLEELNDEKLDLIRLENIDITLQNDTDFHMHIARASRNNRLVRHYKIILDESRRFMYMDLKRSKTIYSWYSNHILIIDALRKKDEIAGVNAIQEILNKQKERIFG
jgi:DNA-binding GntR family transcriptional regulator